VEEEATTLDIIFDVAYRIQGTVTYQDNTVKDVRVEISYDYSGHNVFTDPDGNYVYWIEPGISPTITFIHEDYWFFQQQDVVVPSGGIDIDVHLENVGPKYLLTGYVTNVENQPLQDAWLYVSHKGQMYWIGVATCSDGEFSMYLPNGTYTVSASLWPDYEGFEQEITINGAPKNLEVELQPMKMISGTVTNQDEYPMMGVTVTAWDENDNYAGGGETNEFGQYQFNIPDGEYTLRFWIEDYWFGIIEEASAGDENVDMTLTHVGDKYDFSGTVSVNGDLLAGIWVIAESVGRYHQAVQTNEAGEFMIQLPNESYSIRTYHLPVVFVDYQGDITISGSAVSLNITMEAIPSP
jgi:hypothetical protein